VATPAAAQIDILTNRYDPQRTGANLSESALTSANVNVNRFGKLYAYPVDGAVYAQPLYVRGVVINGAPRNVLYVATMNDKVYAFDADVASANPLWMRDFTDPPTVVPVPISDIVAGNLNIIGNVGITGTPVIDRGSGKLYLVARTKENGGYVQRLHALDIATGADRAGSPVTIEGSVSGNAPDAANGPDGLIVAFDPKRQNQRAGLALTHGVVLVAWSSHEDAYPYHGWMMAFDATTLARIGIFAVTPDAYGGGVWQGGRAPTIDSAGNAYFATGNGKWDGSRNFGDTLLRFSASRTTLALVDYFTPGNEADLNIGDDDLSGSGFTLLPGPNGTELLLGGGKGGILYLLDAGKNLGGKAANDAQILQKIPVNGGHVMGGPVFWKSPTSGTLVYNWAEDDVLKAYQQLASGKLVTSPYMEGQVVSPGHPGGSLTVSANGSSAGTGIIWASMPTSQDGIHGLVDGMLRAYDAETLREVWSSEQNPARDRVGTLVKFVPPVVVNGRVYLPNQNNQVLVFGLLPQDFTISVSPNAQVLTPGTTGAFSVTVGATAGFTGSVILKASGYPPGTTVAFAPASIAGAGVGTMTVKIPADASSGTYAVTVTGTSGSRSHSTTLALTVSQIPRGAGAIGINFLGNSTIPMSPDEVAGVVAMKHWNNAVGASRSTSLALIDETGTTTAATVTWAANATWTLPITDQTGDYRMMRGYLDTSSTSITTVKVAGLVQRTYDVYVYVDGDNRTYARGAAYTISGSGIATSTINLTDPVSTNFSGIFTEAHGSAGNYVKFTINATGFTMTAAPTQPTSSTRRAPINGIEIVPAGAPPPAISVSFVGSAAVTMAANEIAGVVARSHWNNAVGAVRSTPLALMDETGAVSATTMTWTAYKSWAVSIPDDPGNVRMMRGYLDTSSTSRTTVTVDGLVPDTYDVYIYVDGDNRTFARTASYTISGPGFSATKAVTDPANVNFAGSFTEAANSVGNYVKFRMTGTGFSIAATPLTGDNATLRAPINGIQIVAAGIQQ